MSDIIEARRLIKLVLNTMPDSPRRRMLVKALKLMYREPAIQNVKRGYQKIDWRLRRRIRRLQGKYTIHEIANMVGLRNSGRVSEVLHGKR